jgi:hypothetical protein
MARNAVARSLGLILTLTGQCDEAVVLLEQTLQLARQRKTGLSLEPDTLARLAEAQLGAGDLRAARDAAEEGVAVGQRIGAMLQEANAHVALARVLLREEGATAGSAVREALGRAEILYRERGARNLQAFVHLEQAELARLEGDSGARERELRAALELFRVMKAPIRMREVEEILAGLA